MYMYLCTHYCAYVYVCALYIYTYALYMRHLEASWDIPHSHHFEKNEFEN